MVTWWFTNSLQNQKLVWFFWTLCAQMCTDLSCLKLSFQTAQTILGIPDF